jgi:opacity protein-like surface antigen
MRADLRLDWAGDYDVAPGADLSVSSVLGNLYFDWVNNSSFTPYVGAGLGYGWTNASPGNDKDGFAYGLMAGVTVDLTDNIAIDTEYRFRDVMVSGSDPYEHQIMTGLRFEF